MPTKEIYWRDHAKSREQNNRHLKKYRAKMKIENPEKWQKLLDRLQTLPGKQKSSWIRFRFKVLSRDNFTCQYCGAKAPNVELEVDHITSRKDGGKDEMENLITSCWACNQGKNSMSIEYKSKAN